MAGPYGSVMNDIIYLGLILGFFGLSALYLRFCEKL